MVLFSSEGQYIRSIGKKGKSPEELLEPVSICCLEDGGFLVGDRSEHVLKHFNSKEELLHILKKDLPLIDTLYFMTTHPHFGIFIAEPMNKRIIRLNSKLEPVSIYHRPGHRAGEFGTIAGLSIYKNTLFVVDSGNHRIQAFKMFLE